MDHNEDYGWVTETVEETFPGFHGVTIRLRNSGYVQSISYVEYEPSLRVWDATKKTLEGINIREKWQDIFEEILFYGYQITPQKRRYLFLEIGKWKAVSNTKKATWLLLK